MMNGWDLPVSLDVGGAMYKINADFRDIFEVIQYLSSDSAEALYVALALFYDDFDSIPEGSYQEATERMLAFISCGEDEDRNPKPKLIDWEQDRGMIIADINKVAGCEVRSLPYCHWWTFIAWFNGIGEGQLATVVSIREKLRKGKKLETWERDFYHNNRSKVDFKRVYSSAENAEISKWLGGEK